MINFHRSIRKTTSALFFTIIIFILTSCPVPLTKVMLQEVKDEVPPLITMTTPLNGDTYGAYTLLTGTVTDLTNDEAPGEVTSLAVAIPGKEQNIPVNPDGSFTVTLDTNGPGYDGDIIIILTAVDWNNNVEKKVLGLKKAAGDIVGFDVTAGNRTAVISWEALPGAESYSVDEFRTGKTVSGITGTSYTWNSLENGNKASFMVSAEVNSETYMSSIKEVIPLSETTLAPSMESIYRGIKLQWKAIPAASEYVIERSEQKNGSYTIRTITANPYFSDTGMERDSSYFYRVYPVERMDNPDIAISVSNYGSAGYYHGQNDLSVYANYDTPNSAFEVAVKDNLAYVADGTDGLVVIDISDPSNPFLVGSCETKIYYPDGTDKGNAGGIALTDDGKYACVANREKGLVIIDIDPANPSYLTIVGKYETGGHQAYGVDISGNYAYVTASNGGLYKVDISVPEDPKNAVIYHDSLDARKVVVSGEYAYVTNNTNGLKIIKISDMTFAGACSTGSNSKALDVAVSGTHAYVANGYYSTKNTLFIGLKIIDISNPTAPAPEGECALGDSKGVTISTDGKYAYVTDGINGLRVIDITYPSSPSLISTCDTPGDAQSPLINGDYAYVTDYNSGLEIIDVSDPPSVLSVEDVIAAPSHAQSVVVSGDYLSVADGTGGFRIIDVSDPSHREEAGSWHLSDSDARGVDVSGNYAYLVDFLKGLQVIDISDPYSVTDSSSVVTCDLKAATPGRSYGIDVYGSYAYVAEGPNGLQIVDISDPLDPLLAGLSDTDGTTVGVAVSGHYAYLADSSGGLKVIDVSAPDHPVQVSSFSTTGNATGVSVAGNYVFISTDSNGLQILDVSDPGNPSLASPGGWTTAGAATAVRVSGSYAFVTEGNGGLEIIDISDPGNPVSVAVCDTPEDAEDIAVTGRYAYVADGSGGIQVINLAP